ncbi:MULTISPECIES: hypothetical protein [unclassified Butyrivibrio]|uniref:hypothetical protein n=1 Tax=unclassified Butyrivibrio TaxID=2639466 RepID=UPI0003B2ECA1|nr:MULTISPECIES: hypothetical protein [unclassified Butyrivibrio]MDC7293545.1 hypothetical protein [Butyrivibrio sp. DSM 10294]
MKQNLVIFAMVIFMIAFAAWGGGSQERTSDPEGKVATEAFTVETQLPLVAAVGE